ncbi:hypothetical protein [Tistlia consotensis]|uniref:hypothetical protein n=1 Tax=Tistlia consotensis TaxID=1321365 RepID=UPI00117FA7F8|nr:hypothetical protein [Tistlia consotensis]
MPRSDWYSRNAHWLILVVYLAFIAPFIWWSGASQQYNRAYEDYAAANTQQRTQYELQRDCLRLSEPQKALDCLKLKVEANREAQRAEEDLYAQKSMADWTYGAVIVAGSVGLITIVLTFVGVLFVRDTLHETKRTANAAVVSIKEARKNTQKEIRAYVGFSKVNLALHDGGKSANIIVSIKNYGSTPAYKVKYFATSTVFKVGSETFEVDRERVKNVIDIFLNQEIYHTIPIKSQLLSMFLGFADSKTYNLYVFGEIKYQDAFKGRRTTRFRYWLPFHIDRTGENELVPCEKGNKSN